MLAILKVVFLDLRFAKVGLVLRVGLALGRRDDFCQLKRRVHAPLLVPTRTGTARSASGLFIRISACGFAEIHHSKWARDVGFQFTSSNPKPIVPLWRVLCTWSCCFCFDKGDAVRVTTPVSQAS